MEGWTTYTPDGRLLEVEHDGDEWTAHCNGSRAVAPTAAEAIAAVLDRDRASIGAEPGLEAWIAEHAARIEAEAD